MDLLRTADGERLHAVVLPGPGTDWVVLSHGFSGGTQVAALRRVAERLSARATVLAYDARGHGRSSGRTTLGDLEALDVDAAVGQARRSGAGRVATVGFSMGAAAVLRQAGLDEVAGHPLEHRADAVVAVSGTSRWSTRATATRAVRRLHVLVETRTGRAVSRTVLRTRVSPSRLADDVVAPVDCVAAISAPLLVVHGDRDHYFPVEHARALEARGAELWLEEGFGHAEEAIGDDLLDRVGAHVARVLASRGSAA